MPSFGEKLKLEREKRAITLEQISASTKIGTRMLQALEEDKFDQLPGGIFNKGFVRAYARYLGIDEDQTIADYLQASGEGPAKTAAAMENEDEVTLEAAREPSLAYRIPWGLLAAILLLVALALWLWNRRQHAPADQTSSPTVTQAPAINTTPETSSAPPTIPPRPDSNPAPSAPAKEANSVPKPAASAAKSVVPAAELATASPPSGEFTVVILAREDSWLSITADGKPTFVETLLAGDQRAVHSQKEVVIRAGNTGALDFIFNGKKLAPQGAYGEVKTLTFGVGGLQPNATPPPAPH